MGGQRSYEKEKGVQVNMWGQEIGKGQLEEENGVQEEEEVKLRAVGDKVEERPTEFLESTGGFVRWEAVCKGAFVGYESLRVCVCVKVLWECVDLV